MRRIGTAALVIACLAAAAAAEAQRPASPRGQASTQVGGSWIAEETPGVAGGRTYSDGKWIDVDYGRPILRGREDMFGSGDEYGQGFLLGAPVWRLGADQSTRFKTEADLLFGGQRLPAGEYSMFAELSPSEWTLIFSTYGAKQSFREDTPDTLWGSYGYTPDRDVLRTAMQVSSHPASADQLTVMFTDMTQQGGNLTIWWDDQLATVAFTVAP